MKRIYVDIGELGWGLYISAHLRWKKKHTDEYIGVMTHPDRRCLYIDAADTIYNVPDDFYTRFGRGKESYFGLRGIKSGKLREYFEEKICSEYELGGFFSSSVNFARWTDVIFKPYSYSKLLNGRKEILILPRCRDIRKDCHRNLSKEFYSKMIDTLCIKFPDYIIRAIGIPSGSYDINEIKRTNYINDVRQDADLQDLIDRCQVATVAVGSQSALPKITLLQGVPTFMMGHQKERHTDKENWMSTKVEFYDVPKGNYTDINTGDCINKIVSFVEGC